MPTPPSTAAGSRVAWDAMALMVATVGAAGLSLAFWAVAARLYSPEIVGGGAAQVAAINLLASIAQLNLMTILPRLIPVAGGRTPALLRLSYAAIAVSAALAGAWVLLSGDLSAFAQIRVDDTVVLVLCVVVFALFSVEDGVLTAFGKARWVPVIKAVVSVVKLALLWALIGTGIRSAILVSWVVPTGVAVVVVTVFVFGRLARASRDTSPSRLPPPRQLASFVTAEYLNNLLSSVAVFLPPLLVRTALDAASNAYFNIPWLVVLTAQTVLWSAVMSLVVESGRSPDQMVLHFRRILQIGVLIVGAGPLILLVSAPYALGLQGPLYAQYGTPVLRLLALSLPFTGLVILYSSIAVIERKVWKLIAVNGGGAASLTTGTWLLLPRLGLVAVGWVYLAGQAATAVWLLVLLIRSARSADAGAPTRAFLDAVSSLHPLGRSRRYSPAR